MSEQARVRLASEDPSEPVVDESSLKMGSVVLDNDGDVWVKTADGWTYIDGFGEFSDHMNYRKQATLSRRHAPYRVVKHG